MALRHALLASVVVLSLAVAALGHGTSNIVGRMLVFHIKLPEGEQLKDEMIGSKYLQC